MFHPIILSFQSSLVFAQLLWDKNSELVLTLVSAAEQRLVLDTDLKKQRATDEEDPVRRIPRGGSLEKHPARKNLARRIPRGGSREEDPARSIPRGASREEDPVKKVP